MKIVKADALCCDYKNTIVLSYNKGWNDFGYKTEYIIKYFDENGECVWDSSLKIYCKQLDFASSECHEVDSFLSSEIEQLNDDFCSIGCNYDYYLKLKQYLPNEYGVILKRLNDLAFNINKWSIFKEYVGVQKSLLRTEMAEEGRDKAAEMLEEDKMNLFEKMSYISLNKKDSDIEKVKYSIDNKNVKKKYQIFISSTYTDLVEPRQKVRDAILRMMHFPVGMEMFNVGDEGQWEIIQGTIESSDYYVLIIGNRYGTEIENGSDAGISYTEKEFLYAMKMNKPILAFIIDDNVPVEKNFIESDEKKKKLEKFKEKVQKDRMIEKWKNPDELAGMVVTSLHNQMERKPGIGWVRSDY